MLRRRRGGRRRSPRGKLRGCGTLEPMAREAILEAIDRELARLQQVRDLFTDDAAVPAKTPGRRPGRPAGAKRKLSEEARQKIAAGQKKRWAASKAKSE